MTASIRSVAQSEQSGRTSRKKKEIKPQNRPYDNVFTQQRFASWKQVLPPKIVIPMFALIGLVFLPLGIVFLMESKNIPQIVIDYTDCGTGDTQKRDKSNGYGWDYDVNSKTCAIKFEWDPKDYYAKSKGTSTRNLFMYYGLTNFYQNHRAYSSSVSWEQLGGAALKKDSLSDCKPVNGPEGQDLAYYPCGMIANSYFTDQIGNPSNETSTIEFKQGGISWPGDTALYKPSSYKPDQIIPPKNWPKDMEIGGAKIESVAEGKLKYSQVPNFTNEERFMVWMRVAAFPSFWKLWGKTNTEMPKGEYTLNIKTQYEVKPFKGTKSVIISGVSDIIGGKNDFIGIAFIVVGVVFLLTSLAFLLLYKYKPRKLGDISKLSWYKGDRNGTTEELESLLQE